MKILENIVKSFLFLVIIYVLLYFICVYKDEILSISAKRDLSGKIAYSLKGHYIKLIEFPSGKKETIYSVSEEIKKHLGFANDPSFSPDAKMIVFSQSNYLFDDKLYIIDSDGTNIKLFLNLGDVAAICPSWSPDGKKIAFVIQGEGKQGLYIVDIDNPSSLTRISNILPYNSQPAWSPDSKKIVFISSEHIKKVINERLYHKIFVGKVFLVNVDNKDFIPVIGASEVDWSPDGKNLICKKVDGYYIVNIDEKQTYPSYLLIPYKRPFFGIGGSFPVRWSPDGKYIVFCKEIWPGLAGIYVASIDNPQKHIRIATEDEAIIGMSWAE